jgi:hypothetical protein
MPRGPKGERRPADAIGNAIMIGRIATGEIDDLTTDDGKNAATVALGRMGGGGWNDGQEAIGDRQEGRSIALGEVDTPPVVHSAVHRTYTGSSPARRMTGRRCAPAFPPDHQPVVHNLSTGLSTGCPRRCAQ